MRIPCLILNLTLILSLSGCCGSMTADRSNLALPRLERALDAKHAEVAGKGLLYAGASMKDITTDFARKDGVYLGGFDPGRRSVAVRDPVFAHVLYLDDGREPLVIVTLDVIGILNDDVRDIRALASERFQDRIVVASTHDHVGPDLIGFWGPAMFGVVPMCSGRLPDFQETVKALVAEAIDEAARSARPARLRAAVGLADPTLSLNIHPQIRAQKDDSVRVLAVEDTDGRPIAVLANWGCHAESMWDDDQLSADWPGVFYREWTAAGGGVPLFAQGAVGGLVSVNPGDDRMKLEPEIMDVFLKHVSVPERLVLRDRIGKSFAGTVRDAVKGAARTFGPEGVTLSVRSKRFELLEDNWIFEYMGTRRLIQRKVEYRKGTPWLTTEVLAARVRAGTDVVADLVTFPGEPAPPLVAEIDSLSAAQARFNLALGSDEIGYVVREADWDHPEYEYERTMSLGRTTGTEILKVIRDLREGL
jgi:hypothetical protein